MCGRYPKLLPSKAYETYEKGCWIYMPKCEPITEPINIKAIYYMATKGKVDLSNLISATHDILVKYQVIADDNSQIVISVDGSRVLYDKENPRTEITIEGAEWIILS
jgi:Holliday junction resolvase RusA-like endonuclease